MIKIVLESVKDIVDKEEKSGPVFTNHTQEISLSFSPRFANWNVTQLLIG